MPSEKAADDVQYLYSRQIWRRRCNKVSESDNYQSTANDADGMKLKVEMDVALREKYRTDTLPRILRGSTADVSSFPPMVEATCRAATVPPSVRYAIGLAPLAPGAVSTSPSLPAPPCEVVESPRSCQDETITMVNPNDSPSSNHGCTAVTVDSHDRDASDWRSLPFAPPELIAEITRHQQIECELHPPEGPWSSGPLGVDKMSASSTTTSSASASPRSHVPAFINMTGSSEQRKLQALQGREGYRSACPASQPVVQVIDLTIESPGQYRSSPGRETLHSESGPPKTPSAPMEAISQISPTGHMRPPCPRVSPQSQVLSTISATHSTAQPQNSDRTTLPNALINAASTMAVDHSHADLPPPTSKKRPGPWTSKMYADLMQQLQENFPFNAFAQQHDRRRSEVFDVFAAIVQLPLLKHSSEGQSRISFRACKSRQKVSRVLHAAVKVIHRDEDRRAKRRKQVATARKRGTVNGSKQGEKKQRERKESSQLERRKGILAHAIEGELRRAEESGAQGGRIETE